MFLALLASHVITDFALQPDWMAEAKKRRFWALLLHAVLSGLGAGAAAWLYGLPQPAAIAIVLTVAHLAIDWSKIRIDARLRKGRVVTFLADQLLHIFTVLITLMAFGLMTWQTLLSPLQPPIDHRDLLLRYGLAYSVSIFFGYVLLRVLFPGSPNNSIAAPATGSDKYLGMLERGLITTCVVLGQFLLVAAVIAPRLWLGTLNLQEADARQRLALEMLINMALAMGMGLWLRL